MNPRAVHCLVESNFALDGGAMFGIVPKPLWNRAAPADEKNRISLACRCLLIQYDNGKNVLVDVGMGTKWTEKERGIYRIADQDAAMSAALASHGLTQGDVTDVILTHLHLDHAGGLCRYVDEEESDKGVIANFPNATHWVQKENWDWANAPSERDIGSYRPIDFAFLGDDQTPPLQLLDGDSTPMPGVEVRQMNGHTFGMQIVLATTEAGETYAHLADLIPTAAHLRAPYIMGYDLQPLITLAEKKEVLHAASDEEWLIVFEHDPSLGPTRVKMKNDTPELVHV